MDGPDSDLRRLRDEARELKRGVSAGDATAIARVLASHPKYAGRPSERLRPAALTLPDAQATIACEQGFATWSDLVDRLSLSSTNRPLLRWDDGFSYALLRRASAEASALGHSWCGPEHLLLALLNPAEATSASAVLIEAPGSLHHGRPRCGRPAARRADRCSSRRPANDHDLRPATPELRPPRRLCRRGLRRRRLNHQSGSRWLDAFDRVHPIDSAIKRRHATDLRGLGTGNEIGLREVESIGLIDLDGTK